MKFYNILMVMLLLTIALLAFGCGDDYKVSVDGDDSNVDGDVESDGDIEVDGDIESDSDIESDGDIEPDGDVEPDGDIESDGDDDTIEGEQELCSGCLIDGVCYEDDEAHPSLACAYCDAFKNPIEWTARKADVTCREAVGVCDVAETCDGTELDCPTDDFAAGTVSCRTSAGACDVEEFCSGDSVECPADSKFGNETECRASAGVCDVAEVCNGTNDDCPTDGFEANTVSCRSSAGVCDTEEFCSGDSAECPVDSKLGSETECRASAGVCDDAEVCDGVNDDCPTDVFLDSQTECRSAMGVCDDVEYCTGDAVECPSDMKLDTSTVCREATELCNLEETCNGFSNDCPIDQFKDATTVCRAGTDDCDMDEYCTGFAAYCPEDKVYSSSTLCRDAADVCDAAEFCDGENVECPTDLKLGEETVCRPIADACDIAEVCTGDDDTCPQDVIAEDGIICGTCGVCNGIETSCQPVTANDGPYCDSTCSKCDEGDCVARNDNLECDACSVCSTDDIDDCTPETSDTGYLCDTACTKCDAGDCVARNDNLECSDNSECVSEATEDCSCMEGFAGEFCNECADGYFDYPNCQSIEDASPGFVSIESGTFWMGSPDGACPEDYPGDCVVETGRLDNEALHLVMLTYNFELSEHETTELEFSTLMGFNPGALYDSECLTGCGDNYPIKYVSWFDALAYANELSLQMGLTPCYVLTDVQCRTGQDVSSSYMECFDDDESTNGITSAEVSLAGYITEPQQCEGYRLPTEAEWEYAIRTGNQYTPYYQSEGNDGSNSDVYCDDSNLEQIGWFCGNNDINGAKEVGSLAANNFGLYDMSGNVYEYVWDYYRTDYESGNQVDPTGADEGDVVVRGGSWPYGQRYCRSALRASIGPGFAANNIGFRIARTTGRYYCFDEIKNGDETDVDCGGDTCLPCRTYQTCLDSNDCESLNCLDGICKAATCDDGIQNGGEEDIDCGTACNLTCGYTKIEYGSFWMGSPDGTCPEGYTGDCTSELGRDTNEVLHEVMLTYRYELSQYEITQSEFTYEMGWNPSYFGPNGLGADCGDDCPVESVSWYDILAFANQKSETAGFTTCYTLTDVSCVNGGNVDTDYMSCFDEDETNGGIASATVALSGVLAIPQQCHGYRLPTEAEWEFAARAGDQYTAFYQSEGNNGTISNLGDNLDDNLNLIGWYSYNANGAIHAVGGKAPNSWGLYDMSGNVWEWVWDGYRDDYENDTELDPLGAGLGSATFVVKGGGHFANSQNCRSAYRDAVSADTRLNGLGARLVRSLY